MELVNVNHTSGLLLNCQKLRGYGQSIHGISLGDTLDLLLNSKKLTASGQVIYRI